MSQPDPRSLVDLDSSRLLRMAWGKKWIVALACLGGLAAMYYWLSARDSYVAMAVVNIGYRVAPEDDSVYKYLEDPNKIEPRLRDKYAAVFRDACVIKATSVERAKLTISCRGATATAAKQSVVTIAGDLVRSHDTLYSIRRGYRDAQRKADVDQLARIREISETIRSPKAGPFAAATTFVLLPSLMDKEFNLSRKIQMEETLLAMERKTELDSKGVSVAHKPASRLLLIVAGVVVLALGGFAALAWAAVEILRRPRGEATLPVRTDPAALSRASI